MTNRIPAHRHARDPRDVIEKLVHAGYMERKGKQLHSTEAGRTLVDVVSPRLRDSRSPRTWNAVWATRTRRRACGRRVRGVPRIRARIPADAPPT